MNAAHSKTVGGMPVASDMHLFQKQQYFNRSKNLERMVHPYKSILHFPITVFVSDGQPVYQMTPIPQKRPKRITVDYE